jgi:hypothetical protein
MRPLASDEFDKVINPFTVDAGHVQLETDLVEWYSETLRGSFSSGTNYDFDSQQFAWFPTLKHGLCNNDDLEMKPSYIDDASHKTGLNVPGKRPTP